MRPDLPRALQGVGITLLSRVMPEIQTAFGQQEVGLAAQLSFWAAEEAERGADRLISETRATRELLREGLPFASAARAAVEAALATPAAANFLVSTLQTENDAVRKGLIALHAAIEGNGAPEAVAFNERIWAELIESTRRRQFQARLG